MRHIAFLYRPRAIGDQKQSSPHILDRHELCFVYANKHFESVQVMDRYQIALGHYMFCVHYHGGQWSELYAKLCRISEYLKLNPLWKDSDLYKEENELALEVYRNQIVIHGFQEAKD